MRIGRWCFVNRWIVVAVWVVAIVGTNILGGVVGSDFGGDPEAPASESRSGFDVLEAEFGGLGSGSPGTIVVRSDSTIDSPEVRAVFATLVEQATTVEGVQAIGPFDAQALNQIATEGEFAGKIAYARIEVGQDVTFADSGKLGKELAEVARDLEVENPDLQIEVGGQALAEFETPETEVIGLAFAVVVLIISFGSVLAMGMPIAVALGGVGLGLALSGLLSNVLVMPDFAVVIGAMIGLGVGIDYALFIVTRYREGLHQDFDPQTATVAAIDTAGRAVVFAGITVVVSLLGLLLIGLPFIAGLGVSAATTVLVTMVASTTLLPALLGFAGLRVEMTRWRGLVAAGFFAVALLGLGLGILVMALVGVALGLVTIVLGFFVPILQREVPPRKQKPTEQTGWYRWSHQIQAHPWPFAIAGVIVLLFLSIPVFGLRFGFSDEGNFAEESTTRQAYDLLSDGFGPGFNGPFFATAVVGSPDDYAVMQAVVTAIGGDPGVASVSPVIPNDPANPTAALVRIIPTTSPQSVETEELIERLRAEVIPVAVANTNVDVFVTGFGPVAVDFSDYLAGRSLLFFGIVLLLSFFFLMGVFRSLLVPIKAVIMNMLSISAAYGIVVALFQWGHLGSITGIEPAPIEPFIPMMMFAIVFGLSMDYEVFLLSRVKEEYERSGDARNSVANGLASTARVITAAAAIMVVVFGSFLLEDDRITKLFGTGLGMAVLLDATLVRMVLVPATMELLGARNWWIPKWLDKLIPQLNVEGAKDHEEQIAAMLAEAEAAKAAAADAPAGL